MFSFCLCISIAKEISLVESLWNLLIDIEATMREHADVVPNLLAVHCISGCDTVAQYFSIGKVTTLEAMHAGFHLNSVGDLERPLTEVHREATRFITKCYGVNIEDTCTEMSDIRVNVWFKKISRKRPLKSLI